MSTDECTINVYATLITPRLRRIKVDGRNVLDAAHAFHTGLGDRVLRIAVTLSSEHRDLAAGGRPRWHWGLPEPAARAAAGLDAMAPKDVARSLAIDGYAPGTHQAGNV